MKIEKVYYMEYFTEFGYIGLFFASFLAATILPLSSEVILSFLLLNNLNPIILVSVATFGNVLGAFVNYQRPCSSKHPSAFTFAGGETKIEYHPIG